MIRDHELQPKAVSQQAPVAPEGRVLAPRLAAGAVAGGQVLHGAAALGHHGFEGGGPQHCVVHVLQVGGGSLLTWEAFSQAQSLMLNEFLHISSNESQGQTFTGKSLASP